MTWAKATDLDGKPIWLNLLQARMIVPREGSGSTVIFSPEDDAIDVREEPEQLVKGEPQWPGTQKGVGFIRRADNDTEREPRS